MIVHIRVIRRGRRLVPGVVTLNVVHLHMAH